MLALFPSMIFFANATLTETLFMFLLMLSIWLLVEAERRRSRWLFLAGTLVAGYATLVRGLALLLAVVMAPFWLRRGAGGRGTVIKVAVASALIVAVVAPWTARNYGESGSLVLISSNAGVDFYIGHSEGADGRGRIVDELVFRYPELPPAEAEARISRDGFREGIEWALRHPLDEGELALRKAFFLWYRDDEGLRWNDGHSERSIMPDGVRDAMIWVSNVYYWSVMLFAAFGVVLTVRNLVRADADRSEDLPLRSTPPLSRRDQTVAVLLVSLLAYWTLVHVAFFGDPRFHAPVIPVVCVFAAMGLDSVLHRFSAVENVHSSSLRSE